MMTFDCASHKAEALFRDLIDHVAALAADSERCDRVERELLRGVLDIGRELLRYYSRPSAMVILGINGSEVTSP